MNKKKYEEKYDEKNQKNHKVNKMDIYNIIWNSDSQ